MAKTALSPKEWLRLFEEVSKKGIPVTKASKEFGVSRKTFYKWAKRYDPSKSRNVNLKNLKYKSRKVRRPSSQTPSFIEAEIKKLASDNPSFSKYKIAEEIKRKIGKDKTVGVHGVYNVLKRAGLQTQDKREEWRKFVLLSKSEARRRVLDATQRLEMIERSIKLGITVAQVCRDFGISRKTFYKWKNRWEKASRIDDALRDIKPHYDKRHLRIKPELEKEILSLVIEAPNLSKYGIARKISEKLGPVVSPHGVYNALLRNGLNLPEKRLAYSQARAPEVPTPVTWTDRVRYVLEQFIPSLAPAPPPGLSIALNFLKTFSLASIISSATIYSFLWWISLLASQIAQVSVGLVFASIALFMGSLFFLYSLKYYITLAIVLSFSQQDPTSREGSRSKKGFVSWLLGQGNGKGLRSTKASGPGGLEPNLEHIVLKRRPFVSVHIPLFNEKKVVERILSATSNFEYPEYEVILADDSTDETTEIIRGYQREHGELKETKGEGYTLTEVEVRPGVVLKHLHRTSRSGYKGGALRLALSVCDPRTEFVSVFDADFVPYPDTLELFLKYFQATAGTLDFKKGYRDRNTKSQTLKPKLSPIAAVQGYQWHVLNKSENWITRGVRSEYAGSYVIERSGEEIYGGLKQISGAVYMIRRDVLQEVGWDTSITEDFQLTLKLYEKGYKVVYTPYIQAPAECVSTLQRLIRQRMRWAEGHSNNIKKKFTRIIFNKNLTNSEKLEFLYLSPYYLQAFFFLIGTISWLISETLFPAQLPFWTSLWGWSLVLTNLISLPLMNAVGLFLEESEERDYAGLVSFVALTYILVPFQAYASIKGFLEREEGPWFRTPKTGLITDVFRRGTFYRFIQGILPGRTQPALAKVMAQRSQLAQSNPYLALNTANNQFDTPPFEREGYGQGIFKGFLNFDFFGLKGVRVAKRYLFTKAVLASFLAIVMVLNYLALFVYQRQTPISRDQQQITTVESAPAKSDQRSSVATSGSGSGGQVITKVGGAINTNLQENPEALALITRPGEVLAAEEIGTQIGTDFSENSGQAIQQSTANEVYRYSVELPHGTKYFFGLQGSRGVQPVVKIQNQDWWYVRFFPAIQISEDGELISTDLVEPNVEGNAIEWELANGIVARYTALKDRIKADYIVSNKAQLTGNKLDFIVQYNDSDAGNPEDIEERPWEGHLTHELLPEGDISWFGENGREIFSFPKPIVKDENQSEFDGEFNIQKLNQSTSLLSIKLPQDKLDSAVFPLTIDPVAIDNAGLSGDSTAYGNARHIVRDAWGNLIVFLTQTTTQATVFYKNYSATSWTSDTSGQGILNEMSLDLDSNGDIHMATVPTDSDITYYSFPVTRNTNKEITDIGNPSTIDLDTSDLGNRPSLVVVNKGSGDGKEKVAVAWAMNSSKGGTKRGEIRFLQCDVADGCDAASEWKSASEEKNGSGTCADSGSGNVGLPNALDCKGAADDLFFNNDGHTTHHVVLTQVPGRPQRTPTGAFKDINGTLTSLTNAVDDNTGTAADVNSLTTTDYIYVGDTNMFSRIVNDITNNNTNSPTFTTREYCSANSDVDTTCDTFTAVSNFIDNTVTTVTSFVADGSILFDEPSDWVESTEGPGGSTVKGFWVRLRPGGAFDSTVSIAEFEVTDRHSKDLLLVGGVEETLDLGAAYATWDGVDQDKWEDRRVIAVAADAWRESFTALHEKGGDWATFTNFPLTATTDLINNQVYVGYVCAGTDFGDCGLTAAAVLRVEGISNTQSLTITGNWNDTVFTTPVTEGTDIVLSLTSDGADIYLFYVLDVDDTTDGDLRWRKCSPGGGGDGEVCDDFDDWSSANTLADFSSGTDEPQHPQAIVSKAYGDTVAIDVVWHHDPTGTDDAKYERHYVDMADNTEVVAASGDDAYHRDCDTGTDDQVIGSPNVKLGREANDASCSPSTVESENHTGFRFTTVNVAQGANISSSYLDFRESGRGGSTVVDFTVYGEDVDDSAVFSVLTDCTDPCSGAVGERTRTTTSSTQSIDFGSNDYRIDVTDMVQEVVCRGASDAQPCVGNLNGSGTWAANNDLALLLISVEGGTTDNFAGITAEDDTATVMLDPTLQINCAVSGCGTGNTDKDFSAGVFEAADENDNLDHPLEVLAFGAVNTDDDHFASISASLVPSASSSANPIYQFKANNTNDNNTDDLSAEVIVKSTIQTKSYGGPHNAGKTICFQLYNNTTAAWETYDCNGPGTASVCSDNKSALTCDTAVAPDTDITLNSGTITGDTKYYTSEAPGGTCSGSGNDCWAAWRVYQEASDDGSNQIFYADFFSPTFVPERVLWLILPALFLPRAIPALMKRLGLRPRRKYATVKAVT